LAEQPELDLFSMLIFEIIISHIRVVFN